jgi:hypothetical protein
MDSLARLAEDAPEGRRDGAPENVAYLPRRRADGGSHLLRTSSPGHDLTAALRSSRRPVVLAAGDAMHSPTNSLTPSLPCPWRLTSRVWERIMMSCLLLGRREQPTTPLVWAGPGRSGPN